MSMTLQNLQEHWWCLTDDNGLDIPLTRVDQSNVLGEYPIHIAAWKGAAEDIKWLLENGADINQKGDYGMTPLHYAYMSGKRENIEILIAAGADQNIRCDRGLLPAQGRTRSNHVASSPFFGQLRIPGRAIAEHGIEDDEQLPGDGDQQV